VKPTWLSPKTLARTNNRAGDLFVLILAIAIFLGQQIAISNLDTSGGSGTARQLIFFSTTVVLALLPLYFWRYFGAWLISAGIVMNLVPMAAHSGSMPIDHEIIRKSGAFPEVTTEDIGRQTNHGKDIVLNREDIHFFALSDRYVVTVPGYGANIYSLGDFVLFAGVGVVILQVLVTPLATRLRRSDVAAPSSNSA